jgi:hypothetical protein
MDTNTLLIIVVVIFLFGGFGLYARGRWFWTDATLDFSDEISRRDPPLLIFGEFAPVVLRKRKWTKRQKGAAQSAADDKVKARLEKDVDSGSGAERGDGIPCDKIGGGERYARFDFWHPRKQKPRAASAAGRLAIGLIAALWRSATSGLPAKLASTKSGYFLVGADANEGWGLPPPGALGRKLRPS